VGFLDDAKKRLGDAVDKHGDKIGEGLDKAGGLIDKRTEGKYSERISAGVGRAKTALDGLDGRADDIASRGPSASTPSPEPEPEPNPSEGDQPTGPMGSGVPGGGGHRPESDPRNPAGSGGGEDADPDPVPTDPSPVPPEPGADPEEDRSRPSTGGRP
jgi:hypothetical protein